MATKTNNTPKTLTLDQLEEFAKNGGAEQIISKEVSIKAVLKGQMFPQDCSGKPIRFWLDKFPGNPGPYVIGRGFTMEHPGTQFEVNCVVSEECMESLSSPETRTKILLLSKANTSEVMVTGKVIAVSPTHVALLVHDFEDAEAAIIRKARSVQTRR